MGTTLTGTTPQDTYDSLIKVTDNAPLTGSLKVLTDGLGNDSALALSTGAASVTGTLAVSGLATLTASALSLRVGNATGNSGANILIAGASTTKNWSLGVQQNVGGGLEFTPTATNGATTLGTTPAMVILDAGNVGIGTSAPESKLHVAGAATGSDVTLYIDNAAGSALNNSSRLKFSSDTGSSVSNGGAELNCINVNAGDGAVDLLVKSWTGAAYTEKARFLAAGGITFNGDTAAANALDDYEEGTWTPALNAATTAPTGVTYSFLGGRYTKVGRLVSVNFGFFVTSVGTGGAGAVFISGLPFTCAATGGYQEPATRIFGGDFVTASYGSSVYGFVENSGTTLQLRVGQNVDASVDYTQIQVGTFLNANFTYFV